MSINIDNIRDTYDKLVSSAPDVWDVYAGEYSKAMEEMGIPENKWSEDRVVMQMAQESMAQELEVGIPQAPEGMQQRLRTIISRQISSHLRGQNDDIARKGLLLQTIRGAKIINNQFDEDEFEKINRLTIDELQNELVNLTYAYTIDTVLPVIQAQCNLVMPETEQQSFVWENAGALALAGYMEIFEMREKPEVAGYSAELASYSSRSERTKEVFDKIAFGLLVIAGIIAFLALLNLSSTVVASATATILVEGTVAGVGAAVAADVALASGFVTDMLALAVGTTILSGIAALLGKIVDWTSGNSDYTEVIQTTQDVFV